MPRKGPPRRSYSIAMSRGGRGGNQYNGPSPVLRHALTLQEEAQNTERHHSWGNTDSKLRFSKVTFVSAGHLDKPDLDGMPTKQAAPDHLRSTSMKSVLEEENPAKQQGKEPAQVLEGDFDESGRITAESEVYTSQHGIDQSEDMTLGTRANVAKDKIGGPVHITVEVEEVTLGGGSRNSTANGQQFMGLTNNIEPTPSVHRSPSPTPSTSSEEVILFTGRAGGKANEYNPSPAPLIGAAQPFFVSKVPMGKEPVIDSKLQIVECELQRQKHLLDTIGQQDPGSVSDDFSISPEQNLAELELLKTSRLFRRSANRPARRFKQKYEEDALVADYTANADQNDDGSDDVIESFTRRDIDDFSTSIRQGKDNAPAAGDVRGLAIPCHNGWDITGLQGFDDASTSDGVMGALQVILARRERGNGPQYLVVWEDQPQHEARWVPAETLINYGASAHIEAFESDDVVISNTFLEESSLTDSDSEDIPGKGGKALCNSQRHGKITDARIARLLNDASDIDLAALELNNYDSDFAVDLNAKVNRRSRGGYPSVTALADPYDGFDVMDYERLSLRKKSKGRRGRASIDCSSNEIEASLKMAWKRDRVKKKQRRQEREEIRALGLLGSKNGSPDLKQKYLEGMSVHEVKEEIKAFLRSDNTSMTLPPMGKVERKIVHEFANACNLKSKSVGNGEKRFPVLHRNSRTRSSFTDAAMDAIESRLTRRFLPRQSTRSSLKCPTRTTTGGGGGFNSATVSYRDGDVVGASAPELGAENRGRAMLEKMGWSTGTALGTLNNKGILQPVSHVVKTGKAGLG